MIKKSDIFKTILLATIFVLILTFYSYIESHYSRKAEVTYRNGNTVIATDNVGYKWEFTIDDKDTLQVGNKIKLKMCTNYTDSYIFDDIILDYVYMK